MIAGFADRRTGDVFHGASSTRIRKLPSDSVSITRRKLDMINSAHLISDLKIPPGNRLEMMKGDRAGYYSIRINDQLRIVFKFNDGRATEVEIVDYH